jgi:hypothetical protein
MATPFLGLDREIKVCFWMKNTEKLFVSSWEAVPMERKEGGRKMNIAKSDPWK